MILDIPTANIARKMYSFVFEYDIQETSDQHLFLLTRLREIVVNVYT